MNILLAPDSFKGSLSSLELTRILADRAAHHFPQATLFSLPVADGGEGTVDALVTACKGRIDHCRVTGPLGQAVDAALGWIDKGKTAVLEMAQASGLPLMGGQLDPMTASSYGTGEMIRYALDQGANRLILGIGGSATNEGGMGMLSALGAAFFDASGTHLRGSAGELGCIERVDLSKLDPRLSSTPITVLCDVNNPLLGENGATAIYGPQKGVTPALFPLIEKGMQHYAEVLEHQLKKEIRFLPGAGAAGGMGAALGSVLGATLSPGVQTILEVAGFDALLDQCDLVITGEGRLDEQSVRFGKLVSGIAQRCSNRNIPVIALVGGMGEGAEAFYDLGLNSIITTVQSIMPLEDALHNAAALAADAADRAFLMIKIGMKIAGASF